MKTLTANILDEVITPRPVNSYKGTFGKVTLVGGNQQFGGAIIMASTAAVYSGAGLVTTCTDPLNAGPLHSNVPEAMFADFHHQQSLASLVAGATIVVVGPGLGEDEQSQAILKTVFANVRRQQTLVIDGSAITVMAHLHISQPAARVIYTPHQMEWQRLSGIPIADQQPAKNRQVADQLQATVVLKSHRTQIYLPTGSTYQLSIGTPAQAVGGMGDTLAGMVGGFTAQFHDNVDKAVLAAVYAHSAVAEAIAQKQYIVLPHQISRALPAFMAKIAAKHN
ncbi:NAD(P)H-hydrate dehydratase [Limosilactobacillus difficilis]|uniref:NAD(P)H-hydrate dehydratase n=1 Tax=Limosilactobacillus difficilis TaxID=2991838 RepID=UPI0024B89586|nr:NAD(P)H-hydrate dehydratase [Limosilactobacillus difficilis]